MRAFIDEMEGQEREGFARFLFGYAQAVVGDLSRAEVDLLTQQVGGDAPSPRFFTLTCQLCTEIYAAIGDAEAALGWFLKAADSVLIDIEWTDRCPLLASIRSLPGFAAGRLKVRKRVQAMWDL